MNIDEKIKTAKNRKVAIKIADKHLSNIELSDRPLCVVLYYKNLIDKYHSA